jgi:hypothetical protein
VEISHWRTIDSRMDEGRREEEEEKSKASEHAVNRQGVTCVGPGGDGGQELVAAV